MICGKDLSAVEAVLFVSGEPVEEKKLALSVGVDSSILENIIKMLNERYEKSESSLQVLKLDKSYQLCTRKEYSEYIKNISESRSRTPVSQASMETLALIAYNQPVTKSFVESIRGTDSSAIVNKLVEKGLLCEDGRLEIPGRPIAYKTTDLFLRSFGISSLDELPPLEERHENMLSSGLKGDKI